MHWWLRMARRPPVIFRCGCSFQHQRLPSGNSDGNNTSGNPVVTTSPARPPTATGGLPLPSEALGFGAAQVKLGSARDPLPFVVSGAAAGPRCPIRPTCRVRSNHGFGPPRLDPPLFPFYSLCPYFFPFISL